MGEGLRTNLLFCSSKALLPEICILGEKKSRLNYQYVHHEIWVLALIEETVLT